MSYLNNSVATLSYTLNTYNYIYVNAHLYSGTNHNKKIKHIEQLSNLLDDIKANNPSAYLILSGDFNVTLDDKTQVAAALSGLLDKFRMTDIYRKMFPDKNKYPFFTRIPFKSQKGSPKRIDYIFAPQRCWIHTMETLKITPRNQTTI